jgi:hypothetical protein
MPLSSTCRKQQARRSWPPQMTRPYARDIPRAYGRPSRATFNLRRSGTPSARLHARVGRCVSHELSTEQKIGRRSPGIGARGSVAFSTTSWEMGTLAFNNLSGAGRSCRRRISRSSSTPNGARGRRSKATTGDGSSIVGPLCGSSREPCTRCAPHSGPRRAERAKKNWQPAKGSVGYQRQSPWLAYWIRANCPRAKPPGLSGEWMLK